jgi:hypothetical protein
MSTRLFLRRDNLIGIGKSPYHSQYQAEIGSDNLHSRQLSVRDGFRFARHQDIDARRQSDRDSNSALLIKSLSLLKVVPEVIDPVVGSSQLGCIKG